MLLKTIGAICVIGVCSGVGLNLAYRHMKEIGTLQKLLVVLDFMENELRFRLTKLPKLCMMAAEECEGVLRKVFLQIYQELQTQTIPDVKICVFTAIAKVDRIPTATKHVFYRLGTTLGRFDLVGQLKGFEAVKGFCQLQLEELNRDSKNRIRGYQTLGLCTGAALAILLI